MSDNYTFRDVKPRHGQVGIGRANTDLGRDYQDGRSWQLTDNGDGRDYYDRRPAARTGYDIRLESADAFGQPQAGRGPGRLLATIGVLTALAGLVGSLLLILSFLKSLDADSTAPNPFASELVLGIPAAPLALAAIVVGGVVAAIGRSMARSERRRSDIEVRFGRQAD
jgi:hypothetical protein